jgi:hypothetical protein
MMQSDALMLVTFYPWPATIGVWLAATIVFCIWWLSVRFRIETKNELLVDETVSGPQLQTMLEIEAENLAEE